MRWREARRRSRSRRATVNLFARKSIDELRAQAFAEEEHGLRRALTATNLVALGIGAIIDSR